MSRIGAVATGAAFVASMFGVQKASALTFNITDSSHTFQGTAAEQSFKKATDYWSSVLANDVTVNLDVSFVALTGNAIGSTLSSKSSVSVAQVYGQLAATGNGALDATALAHLQPLDANGGLSFITNSNAGGVISKTAKVYDNDDSINNLFLSVNTSVMKALGFAGFDAVTDASIRFNNNIAYDFDTSDGMMSSRIDFVGAAIHEIGHALGFVSGVDIYDRYAQGTTSSSSGVAIDLNNQAIFSTLDLFRYTTDPRNLSPGAAPALDMSLAGNSYFSIDGSVYNGAYFSTGVYAGNGQQASHFKDTSGCGAQIGIMDPTFCHGQLGVVTDADLAAFDALGWNLSANAMGTVAASQGQQLTLGVPEPASWISMVIGFGLAGMVLRRRASALPHISP